ncbi:MAG: hypothetical protein HY366_01830, partial [Candidatus Aenigmarchaeota archaeon]|nr:hypothetical protein [Candidatus Aenigmarchaeota archaeon]
MRMLILLVVLVAGCVSPSAETAAMSNTETTSEPNETSSAINGTAEEPTQAPTPHEAAFIYKIFDPELVNHITPLGELNGGYSEAQALGGVMVNLKPEAYANNNEIEVRAPAGMVLERYAYWSFGGEKSWVLHFRVSPDVVLKY